MHLAAPSIDWRGLFIVRGRARVRIGLLALLGLRYQAISMPAAVETALQVGSEHKHRGLDLA